MRLKQEIRERIKNNRKKSFYLWLYASEMIFIISSGQKTLRVNRQLTAINFDDFQVKIPKFDG